MIVRTLKCHDFRNYADASFTFAPGINVIYGDNAQGKTNILEALYMCSSSHSHRGSKDRDVIRFGSEESHLRMEGEKKEVPFRIDMHLKKGKAKGIAVNGMPVRKISEFLGLANMVFFSPEDLSIIKSSPGERRRFMDLELCQLDPFYTYSLANYNKALIQRNKLLKDVQEQPDLMDTLPVWDAQLVQYGKSLIERRLLFMKELEGIIRRIHGEITGGKEELAVEYLPNVKSGDFVSALQAGRHRELSAGSTLFGPHRDDLSFRINGIEVRYYGSQGQQRTAALSLKMAELDLVEEKTGDQPVLLLDDVLSELDTSRQTHLLERISHVQTILTCTGLDDFVNNNLQIEKTFFIEKGSVKE